MCEMSLVSNAPYTQVVQLFHLKFCFLQPSSHVAMGRDLAQDLREHCGLSDPLHLAIPAHNRPNTCDKQTLFWTDVVLSCHACQCLTRGFAFI